MLTPKCRYLGAWVVLITCGLPNFMKGNCSEIESLGQRRSPPKESQGCVVIKREKGSIIKRHVYWFILTVLGLR